MNNQNSNTKSKIIKHLRNKFIRSGFQNFKMEDIAAELKISKKTIYTEFTSKKELIRTAFANMIYDVYKNIAVIINSDGPFLEKFNSLSQVAEVYLMVFNENNLQKLEQFYPDLVVEIEGFRKKKIFPLLNLLIDEAKKHRVINQIDNEILLKMLQSSLTAVLDRRWLAKNNYEHKEAFRKVFNLLLTGVLTKKGRKFLKYQLVNDN